jgi:hypothetical protein
MNMKPALAAIAAFIFAAGARAETLYNGIELPAEWPPRLASIPQDPVTPPYLKTPPKVIPIDVGRQLFVDDFLVENSALKRDCHLPKVCEKAVHRQMCFSGGVWYDPADKIFKMWYDDEPFSLATSADGRTWKDVAATNVKGTHSTNVFMDLDEKDPAKRYKMIYTDTMWQYTIRYSADGVKWSPAVKVGGGGDRGTAFYNPFRKVWVYSIRLGVENKRSRFYWEVRDFEKGPFWQEPARANAFKWTSSDSLDLPHPDMGVPTQLYALDAIAYESVMLGFFSIWHGDTAEPEPASLKNSTLPKVKLWTEQRRDKLNAIKLGYSRDGWHWARPDRRIFIGPVEDPKAWNFSNVQSVGGGVIIVGDRLYIYFSGREAFLPKKEAGTPDWNGLAYLRRDGFVSMDADAAGGALTTRPVSFKGKCLFVNLEAPEGELRVDVLDEGGKPIAPFTKENCKAVKADSTMQAVAWEGAADLSALAGKTVKFRFHLKNGRLYSFWVSPDESGASQGYVAAGGPGFTGHKDTVGRAAYEAAKAIPKE